jgi:hypothetical protein
VLTIHLIDGSPGDDDVTVNGVIVDPGAPLVLASHPPQVTPGPVLFNVPANG